MGVGRGAAEWRVGALPRVCLLGGEGLPLRTDLFGALSNQLTSEVIGWRGSGPFW